MLFLDEVKARDYTFASAYGDLGPVEAFDAMRRAGARLFNQRWVDNHWSLIVWKLAALARSRPDEWRRWWTFDAVVDQLLYRSVLL